VFFAAKLSEMDGLAFFVVKIRFFSADFASVLEKRGRVVDSARLQLEQVFVINLSVDYLFTVGDRWSAALSKEIKSSIVRVEWPIVCRVCFESQFIKARCT